MSRFSFARLGYYFIILSIFAFSLAIGILFYFVQNTTIDFSILENYQQGKPTILLDDEGNEWARFALDKREPIILSQVPPHVIHAFIAAEDHNFFSHYGISLKGILRSFLVNLYHGKIVQGASTITQQLIKLLFFDSKRTFKRKIKEQFYALLVEQQCTKQQILQTYLNHIYFGCGIYGIQSASQRFWDKPAHDLTIDEAATLAGVVKSPSSYCPLLSPLSSKNRRDIILSVMKKMEFITQEEYERSLQEDLHIANIEKDQIAPHLKETIRQYIEENYGKQLLYSGGLTIQTTINRAIQQQAQFNFNNHIKKLQTIINPKIDGGLICMDVRTGQIKALIGGYDFATSKFNRALQAHRQIGSIFKTVVYAAALEQGMNFAQTMIDEPLEITQNKTWKPHNYNEMHEGIMTLAHALSVSNNIIAIKTLLTIGYQPVFDLAKRAHLLCELKEYPSIALGCIDGTVAEVAGMFNIFANNGMYCQPHFIKWIKNEWGKKIMVHKIKQERVLSSAISSQVAKVLSIGMNRAKKRNKKWMDTQAIGKTGTTNDCRVTWFAGSTPDYTTVTCLGCDNNESLGKQVYGSKTGFPIWLELNQNLPIKTTQFSLDPHLREILIDGKTGELVSQIKNAYDISILV